MFITTKDAEIKLVETVQSLKEEGGNWLGIVFHFSRLLDHYKSDYQIKIAVNLINDLLRVYQGGVFVCFDSTIFVVCRDVSDQLLGKIIFQMRYLFMDDPLSYNNEGQENPQFCTAYDLTTRWNEFMALCRKKMTESARPGIAAEEEIKSRVFDPFQLLNVERALEGVDLAPAIRRQPICAMLPDTPIRRVFDELYINIAHLRQLLRVEVDLLSNRWLFKYLTQILDEKIIMLLRRDLTRFLATPVSLNLNVQTLLSSSFAEFDAAIHPNTKVAIIIELQVADVFADMGAFMVAREAVQRQGYRVCLDGLNSLSFMQVNREQLGFDLAKLQWNADLKSDLTSSDNHKLADAVRRCGSNRVILCRCDNKQAVDYGQELGISLFQGRHLDARLNPAAKIEN